MTGTAAAPGDPPALEVAGLRKAFGTTVAVDDVSFAIPAGGSLGLVGESGSGKTTVARIVVGLLRADAGDVRIDGAIRPSTPARSGAARLARARQAQIVFQDPYLSLDPRIAAGDAVAEVLALHGLREPGARRDRVRELLDQVGLGQREAQALPRELSGGQRQRVAIARALAAAPRLLILDESVAALDVSIQAQILNLLDDIRRETRVAYLLISHDLAVVHQVAEQIAVMYRGRLVEQGTAAQVLRDPRHPYTRLLLASIPRMGWDPAGISAARRLLHAS
jgi:peptide/nickel transport system ATP-binding protein